MGVTKVKLKRSFSNGNLNIIQALSAASNMTLAFGEPVWFKNTFYGGEKLFVADDSGAPVFIGPYKGSEYINVNNDPTNANLGTISLDSSIEDATEVAAAALNELNLRTSALETLVAGGDYIEVQSLNVTRELYAENLAYVAYSGAYSDLTGKPTNVSSFTNDAGYLTSSTLPSDLFYVTFSKAAHSNGAVTSSKTYAEINAAISANKLVIASYTPAVTGAIKQYFIAPVAEDSNTLLFTNISPNNRNEILFVRMTSSAATLTIEKDYNIPDVANHDGKVLIADANGDSVYWGTPSGIDTISSGDTIHQVTNDDDIEFKTVNGSSIIGSGDIAIDQDYERVMNLIADAQMSDIFNSTSCNNANLLLTIDADRVVSMDTWAQHENYVVVNNISSSPHTITFDYSGEGIVMFLGNGEYVVGTNSLQVTVPANSYASISMRVMNDKAVLFSVDRVRVHNTPVTEAELADDDVAIVLKHNTSGEIRYMTLEDIQTYNPDLSAYTVKPYVRFHRGRNGRSVVMHKTVVTSNYWAEFNRYKLECTTSSAGSFTWSVNINGTVKGSTVTWTADATLDSIVTQLNEQAVSTYLVFQHVSDEDFIRITKGGYANSIFTLSASNGATLTDLSKYTKVNGVQQSETHREWQADNVHSMFPNSGFLPANTVQYARNGYNLSYMCGGNLERYKQYYGTNGSATYVAESSIASRMTAAGFASLNGSGVVEQQALYDKYNGSWDVYMEASMVQIDDMHTNGIEYQSYDNGDTQTAFLASVTTMTFDGSYIPAYPSAYATRQFSDADITAFNMPTEHELAVFMEDSNFAKINAAFTYIGGATALGITSYYWSVARYGSTTAWLYYGDTGPLGRDRLCDGFQSRALAYLN